MLTKANVMTLACRIQSAMYLLVLGLVMTVFVPLAAAHPLDITYTTLSVNESGFNLQTNLTARQAALAFLKQEENVEAAQFIAVEQAIQSYIQEHVVVTSSEQDCELTSASLNYDRANTTQLLLNGLQYRSEYACPSVLAKLTIVNTLFSTTFPDQRNIMVFSEAASAPQHVFTPEQTQAALEVSTQAVQFAGSNKSDESLLMSLWRFIRLGFEHVLIGYDHIAFIIGVHLVIRKVREILKIVTSFTIAHSITLTLATLGIIELPSSVVEAAIAATIVYIGVENIIRRQWLNRWRITFALGLIHGLGFSSVLREIGIPQQFLIPDLIGFNIGVEIGQITIVALLLPVLLLVGKWPRLNAAVVYVGSIMISIAGLVWFLQRVPSL